MAAARLDDTDLECPVCHDDFQDPKILPCTHLVCRKCLLSWLSKEGTQGGCPLCRAPILSSTSPAIGSFDNRVDDLPTDLAIQSAVETQKFLNSAQVCSLCDGKVAASSFCLQCTVKLCQSCAKMHKRIPLLQIHTIEDLANLTAERLAETCHMTCKNHSDRLVELYCCSHEELICMLCFPTNHRNCGEVKAIADVAKQKRAELKDRADTLLDKEAKLSSQMQTFQNEFKTIRKKAEDVFDDLEKLLRRRRQTVMNTLQAEEEAEVMSLSKMEKDRAALKAHAGTVKKLASSAASDALLGMLGKLTSRLQDLEQTAGAGEQKRPAMEVTFDSQQLKSLKDSILALGQIKRTKQKTSANPARAASTAVAAATSPPPQAEARPTRQIRDASDLRNGDRVKRGPHWKSGDVDGKDPGTVRLRGFGDLVCQSEGLIPVKWDRTQAVSRHQMRDGIIELELL